MPRSDYLKTCTDIPALPKDWYWSLSYHQIDRDSSTVPGKVINWTKLLIEISDQNDVVQASHVVSFMTSHIQKYPGKMDQELGKGCRYAYHNLYSDRKVSFYEAMDIGPRNY